MLKTAVMFFKYWKALIVWTCRLGVPTAGQVEAENTYILNSPLQKRILHLNSSMIFRFEPLIVNLPGSCWGSLLCFEGHVFLKKKFSSEEDLKNAKRFETVKESKKFEVVFFFFWGGVAGMAWSDTTMKFISFFLWAGGQIRVLLRQAKYIRSIVMNFAAGNATAGKPSWPWLGFQYG